MPKQNLNICLLGNVDCGKSTLTRKLVEYLNNTYTYSESIKEHFIEIKNYNLNVMDVRVDSNIVEKLTKKFTEDYTNGFGNVILFVIDSSFGAYEAGLDILKHLLQFLKNIESVLYKQLIFCVNKMDVDYSQDRFKEIVNEITRIINRAKMGHFKEPLFIPISALKGENIMESCNLMSWNESETLLDVLNAIK